MPRHPGIAPAPLIRALREYDLPAPVSVTPVGRPSLHAWYRLGFQGARVDAMMLLRVLHCPGWDTVQTEHAALQLMAQVPELPGPTEFHVVPPAYLGFPAALVTALPGQPAGQLVADGTLTTEQALRQVGAVRAALDAIRSDSPAIQAAPPLGFVSVRDTWREEWLDFHHLWLQTARAYGTTLGPVSDELEAIFADRIDALDTAEHWTLVHRDLHPGNLLIDPATGSLTGVVDWGGALVGDPVLDWVQLLQVPTDWLAAFVEGYGRDRAEALLTPEAIARLEVYTLTRCVARLARAGMPPFVDPSGRAQALALEVARDQIRQFRAPHFVRDQIRAALEGSARPGTLRNPPARDVVLRRAVERFRFVPVPIGHDAVLIAAALAAILDDALDPGTALVGACAPVLAVAAHTPIPDRAAWRDEIVARVARESGGHRLSALVLWLGLAAIDALDGAVSDGVLRGLETAVLGRLAEERRGHPQTAQQALVGGLGWWCAHGKGSPDAEAVRHALVEAWDTLEPFPVAGEHALPEPGAWPTTDWAPHGPEDALLPVLLLALRQIEDWPLPAERGRVWQRLSTT